MTHQHSISTDESNTNMRHQNNYNLSILILENTTYYDDNMTSAVSDTSWLITLLDRSQQVMTIIGVIANVVTSITLIRNGQVSVALNFFVDNITYI